VLNEDLRRSEKFQRDWREVVVVVVWRLCEAEEDTAFCSARVPSRDAINRGAKKRESLTQN
jgi:hypothetical protein